METSRQTQLDVTTSGLATKYHAPQKEIPNLQKFILALSALRTRGRIQQQTKNENGQTSPIPGFPLTIAETLKVI